MKVSCEHGYFHFQDERRGECSNFATLFELDLSPVFSGFTFTDLLDVPDYSVVGADLMGTPATATYSGPPGKLFEANSIVYNFSSGLVVPISSVVAAVSLENSGNFYVSDGLILPGSRLKSGQVIKGYTCHLSFDTYRFIYTGVDFV